MVQDMFNPEVFVARHNGENIDISMPSTHAFNDEPRFIHYFPFTLDANGKLEILKYQDKIPQNGDVGDHSQFQTRLPLYCVGVPAENGWFKDAVETPGMPGTCSSRLCLVCAGAFLIAVCMQQLRLAMAVNHREESAVLWSQSKMTPVQVCSVAKDINLNQLTGIIFVCLAEPSSQTKKSADGNSRAVLPPCCSDNVRNEGDIAETPIVEQSDDTSPQGASDCLVKVYDDYTEGTFKMNEIVEFVGILGFEPSQTIFNSGEEAKVRYSLSPSLWCTLFSVQPCFTYFAVLHILCIHFFPRPIFFSARKKSWHTIQHIQLCLVCIAWLLKCCKTKMRQL
jgi:hypothetical protein